MTKLKTTHAFNSVDIYNFDLFNAAAHNYHILDKMIKLLLSRPESFELAYKLIDSFLQATVPYNHEISKYFDAVLYETEDKESSSNPLEDN